MELFHENQQIQAPTFDGIGKYVLSPLLESSLCYWGTQCLKISKKVSLVEFSKEWLGKQELRPFFGDFQIVPESVGRQEALC